MQKVVDIIGNMSELDFDYNTVLTYDGKKHWMAIQKEQLFKEYNEQMRQHIAKIEAKNAELEAKWKEFMAKYTEQNSQLIALVESLVQNKEK